MFKLPEGIENTFRYILIAAKRAEQLVEGARPRVTTRHVKPTTVSLAELAEGKVPWRAVTPEEYETLRQEEIAAREKEEHSAALITTPRPVVPVAEEPEVDEEEDLEEFEDELQGPDLEAGELGEADAEPAAVPEVTEDLLEPEE